MWRSQRDPREENSFRLVGMFANKPIRATLLVVGVLELLVTCLLIAIVFAILAKLLVYVPFPDGFAWVGQVLLLGFLLAVLWSVFVDGSISIRWPR